MSNMHDAMGLCLQYGKVDSEFETEFEPALGTVWARFNQKGVPCYSPGLLKAMIALETNSLPASLHIEKVNEDIDFDGLNVRVNTSPVKLFVATQNVREAHETSKSHELTLVWRTRPDRP